MAVLGSEQAEWDPIRLTYGVDGEEVELPFKLLVVGPFGAIRAPEETRAAISVTADGVDAVLRERRLQVALTVEDYLVGDGRSRDIKLELGALADFEPARLVECVPILSAAAVVLERLRQAGRCDPQDDWERDLFEALGVDGIAPSADLRDYAIAELTDRLGRQLDAVLHHPEFQRVEAVWRGLALLVARAGSSGQTRIDILDIDRASLLEDFRAAGGVDESLFFQTVYADEFGQYGGEPYGAVIGGFEVGRGADDRELLRHIAEVCARAHAPFIGGAAPGLLGLGRFAELVDAAALSDLHGSPRWTKWWQLANEPTTRYVGLTAPRVLLRSPYGPAHEGRVPVEAIQWGYREQIGRDHEHRLWGVAAFGFAECLIRSFERYRVCVDVTGPNGGRIEGLPPIDERAATGRTQPVEVMISEQKEIELTELGLMPVSVARARGYVGFNSANSLHWAGESMSSDASDAEAMGVRLGAQLQYVFLISRIAHYLKVIQRDMVGAMRTEAELQSELDAWLRRYVSDVDEPAPELRARRPLRSARLTVTDETGDGSSYRMHLEVVPHTKVMNTPMALDVEGTLGRA